MGTRKPEIENHQEDKRHCGGNFQPPTGGPQGGESYDLVLQDRSWGYRHRPARASASPVLQAFALLLRSEIVNEPFFLRHCLKLDAQAVRDLALKDRPDRVGIQIEIENSELRDLGADEVEKIPHNNIRWIVSHGHLHELITADRYAEAPSSRNATSSRSIPIGIASDWKSVREVF